MRSSSSNDMKNWLDCNTTSLKLNEADNGWDRRDASDNVDLSVANDTMRGTSIIRGTHVPTTLFRGSVCIPLLSSGRAVRLVFDRILVHGIRI
ncbi:hypothetical protein MFFC18_13430 [Mariniblastus fucicola]|uniref:Uncharacterized protein n=1 Tax=Mariniblastus fucicola TaxID=980251 RepID=A0A5B9P4H6_9BACT|nr:hypothetical protein MFFC18_13430 [Mariniblastus fucicola]